MSSTEGHTIYQHSENYSEKELIERSKAFREHLEKRRSLRYFSDKAVPEEVIKNIIMTASSAPSGANKQPWWFVAVSNPNLKSRIREAAEKEEEAFYSERAPETWLKDLEPLGTDAQKPFLETAPWLIVAFRQNKDLSGQKNYYVQESAGIACGFLIAAIHHAGLVTLTHTPSPMNFLSDILQRPENEKAFLLLPVGYAAENASVPVLRKKTLEEVSSFYR
jgi:nitroreductase